MSASIHRRLAAALIALAACGCQAKRPLHEIVRAPLPDRAAPGPIEPAAPGELLALAQDLPAGPAPLPLAAHTSKPTVAEPLNFASKAPRPHIGGPDKVNLELRGLSLAEAIHLIAEAAGVNLYLDQPLDAVVDASFPSITLDDALAILLERNGLRLTEEPGPVYWVEPDDERRIESALWQLQSANASELSENLKALVGADTKFVVDSAQNFIIARGPRADLGLITEYLGRSDRLKRQVLIEARIVEVSLGEDFALGLSHVIDDAHSDPHTLDLVQNLATTGSPFSLVYDNATVPITSTLTALAKYTGLNQISAPRVLAVHGSQARIDVVTEVPYIQTTSSTSVGGGTAGNSTLEQVAFKEAGVKLTITPHVQEGGVVQMKLTQELSEVTGFFSGVPVIEKRTLDSDLLVGNGNTVVLGGLMETTKTETDKGVPLLMDLPLIGRLFRSDDDSGKRRELLLFLTPRVLSPGEAASLAGLYADRYTAKLGSAGLEPLRGL